MCSGLSPTTLISSSTRSTPVVAPRAVDAHRLGDDRLHRHPRVQRHVRVLEDDLEMRPQLAHLAAPELEHVAAVEPDRARSRRSSSRSTQRPVVDFPQPDSPTRPSVSPRSTEKEIPDTACTSPTTRRKNPARIGNVFTRSTTSSTGGPLAAGVDGTVRIDRHASLRICRHVRGRSTQCGGPGPPRTARVVPACTARAPPRTGSGDGTHSRTAAGSATAAARRCGAAGRSCRRAGRGAGATRAAPRCTGASGRRRCPRPNPAPPAGPRTSR